MQGQWRQAGRCRVSADLPEDIEKAIGDLIYDCVSLGESSHHAMSARRSKAHASEDALRRAIRESLDAAEREAERLRTGQTIEGDRAGAADLWRANVEPLIERLRDRHDAGCNLDDLDGAIGALLAAVPRKEQG